MKILGVIPARKNSQRIVGKNRVRLAKKPLMQWTINAASASKKLTDIVVCTDYEPELVDWPHVLKPKGHDFEHDEASDAVVATLNMPHIAQREFDYVVMLLPSSPFRTAQQIDEAITLYEQTFWAINLVSVVKHPDTRKVRRMWGGTLETMTTPLFLSNGAIQVSRVGYLLQHKSFHHGSTIPYIMDAETGLDIDTYRDLELARSIAKDREINARRAAQQDK